MPFIIVKYSRQSSILASFYLLYYFLKFLPLDSILFVVAQEKIKVLSFLQVWFEGESHEDLVTLMLAWNCDDPTK